MEDDVMLTTVDNPFDPFTEFVAWFKYDMLNGYNTCGLLAREAATSSAFSDEKNEMLTKNAINEIVLREPFIYRKVYPNSKHSLSIAN